MIRVTYQSAAYERGKVTARYVRLSVSGEWQWCEVDATRRDVRQGTCGADDVPPGLIEPARVGTPTRVASPALRGACRSHPELRSRRPIAGNAGIDHMSRLVTTQEILIILSPALALAAIALALAIGLTIWERRHGR